MQKNDTFIGTCIDYTQEGLGVVKDEEFVFFVPNLIKGEVAEIGITALKKSYGYGRIVKLITSSSHRITPMCEVHRLCGGCQLMHMDHDEQMAFKMRKVEMCFEANAGFTPNLLPIISQEPYDHYRNKVQIPVQVNNHTLEMGFYQNHTNKIIPFDHCYMESTISNEITKSLKKLLETYHVGEYVRHILVKHAHVTGEVMVVLIVRKRIKNVSNIANDLIQQYPHIVSFQQLLNRRTDNVILDGEIETIYGRDYIEEKLLDNIFRIHAKSFFQINPYVTPILYSKAIEGAKLTGKEVLVDLYCGTGTMGIIASKFAKKVYGIEIVPEAIIDARINAKVNDVTNIDFLTADANRGAQRLIKSKIKVDAMIVDPPRKGLSKDTIDAILKISPKRLVYVSCDPSTLARDVKILKDHYNIESIQPCDMFPNTFHVECVVLMTKVH